MQQEVIIVIAAVIIVLLFLGVMFMLSLIYFNNKKRRVEEEKNQMEAFYEQEMLRTRIEVQEESFKNISQEIHDNIGQALSLLKLTLATAEPENAQKVAKTLTSSIQITGKAIKDLRELAHTLSPNFLEKTGFLKIIEQKLEQVEKTGQYKIYFESVGYDFFSLKNPQKEIVLIRIIQELLTNIIKHSKATEITVRIEFSEPCLRMTVADNGQGFETAELKENNNQAGIGLNNIDNRVKLIGGKLSVSSTIGIGTSIYIEL